MKEYLVTLPATMAVTFKVKASSEEEAIEKAFEYDCEISLEDDNAEITEFQFHSIAAEGNCYHGVLNEPEVEEIEE